MGFDTTAQYHRDRAAQFRSHAEHARLAETREMYLRLASPVAGPARRLRASRPALRFPINALERALSVQPSWSLPKVCDAEFLPQPGHIVARHRFRRFVLRHLIF